MATKVTNTYPGQGWVATGYKNINGVKTTIWTKKTVSSGGSSTGGSSGGGSSGGGSSGSSSKSSSGDTADKKAKRVASWTKLYWGLVEKSGGKLSAEAQKLIAWAAADEQGPSPSAFLEKMRQDDQTSYLKTSVAEKRFAAIKPLLQTIFKGSFNMKDKEIAALIVKFQLGDPDKLTQGELFNRYVRKTALFKNLYSDFNSWLNQSTGFANKGDPFGSFDAYAKLRDQYTNAYTSKFGSTAVIPPALLKSALMGNWDLQGAQWNEAMAADSNWGNVTGYKERVAFFNQQWASIFKGSAYGDIEPPSDIAKKFGQGTMGFDELFQSSIRSSTAFQSAFPDFELYAQATFERVGTPVGSVGIGDYLQRRADYIEHYKNTLEDPDAMPDPALLAKALASNWSNTQWDLTIEKNDPKYKTTEAYKAKQAEKLRKGEGFDLYWKSIFGETSTPDGGMRAEFMDGTLTDTDSMWEQIKGTQEFQSQYAQWDTFAKAQNDQGVNVMENPGLYKQYQKAFYDAFSDQGIQAPQGFDRMFFASGINDDLFKTNVQQYSQTSGAYQWQSGKDADMATATGIADKTAGGDLRKKMEAAIRQHQQFAQSRFNTFQTEKDAGSLTQKI